MANKLTVTYNGSNIINGIEISGDATVTYNGSTITTVAPGQTKTLNCAEQVMKTNVEVGGKTLNCAKYKMATNVDINVQSLAKYIYQAGYSAFQNCTPTVHSNATITWEDSRVKMNMKNLGDTPYVALYTDFTPYKKLVIDGYASGAASSVVTQSCGFGYGSSPTWNIDEMEASNNFFTDTDRATYTFDISNVSGNKYINFRLTVGCAVWIYDIHLE